MSDMNDIRQKFSESIDKLNQASENTFEQISRVPEEYAEEIVKTMLNISLSIEQYVVALGSITLYSQQILDHIEKEKTKTDVSNN